MLHYQSPGRTSKGVALVYIAHGNGKQVRMIPGLLYSRGACTVGYSEQARDRPRRERGPTPPLSPRQLARPGLPKFRKRYLANLGG